MIPYYNRLKYPSIKQTNSRPINWSSVKRHLNLLTMEPNVKGIMKKLERAHIDKLSEFEINQFVLDLVQLSLQRNRAWNINVQIGFQDLLRILKLKDIDKLMRDSRLKINSGWKSRITSYLKRLVQE